MPATLWSSSIDIKSVRAFKASKVYEMHVAMKKNWYTLIKEKYRENQASQ